MRATMSARNLRLLVRAHRADHGDAERACPLAGDETDAARGRVVQNGLSTLERIHLTEQILHRHAFHHQRRRRAVGDAVGQFDQDIGRHDAHIGIGALRTEQVTDAIAHLDVGDVGADGLDHAHGIGAEAVRERQRIAAGAEIDIDEIDRNVRVAYARLTGARSGDLDGLELQDFRATGFMETYGFWHRALLMRAEDPEPAAAPAASSSMKNMAKGH